MKLDAKAKYQDSHEWARQEGDLIVCGISDHAQESLSDVVYVEFPEVGDSFRKGDTFGVVESVKAASDLCAPLSGKISDVNSELDNSPELVNEDPYEKGWLFALKGFDASEMDNLMDAAQYEAMLDAEEEEEEG